MPRPTSSWPGSGASSSARSRTCAASATPSWPRRSMRSRPSLWPFAPSSSRRARRARRRRPQKARVVELERAPGRAAPLERDAEIVAVRRRPRGREARSVALAEANEAAASGQAATEAAVAELEQALADLRRERRRRDRGGARRIEAETERARGCPHVGCRGAGRAARRSSRRDRGAREAAGDEQPRRARALPGRCPTAGRARLEGRPRAAGRARCLAGGAPPSATEAHARVVELEAAVAGLAEASREQDIEALRADEQAARADWLERERAATAERRVAELEGSGARASRGRAPGGAPPSCRRCSSAPSRASRSAVASSRSPGATLAVSARPMSGSPCSKADVGRARPAEIAEVWRTRAKLLKKTAQASELAPNADHRARRAGRAGDAVRPRSRPSWRPPARSSRPPVERVAELERARDELSDVKASRVSDDEAKPRPFARARARPAQVGRSRTRDQEHEAITAQLAERERAPWRRRRSCRDGARARRCGGTPARQAPRRTKMAGRSSRPRSRAGKKRARGELEQTRRVAVREHRPRRTGTPPVPRRKRRPPGRGRGRCAAELHETGSGCLEGRSRGSSRRSRSATPRSSVAVPPSRRAGPPSTACRSRCASVTASSPRRGRRPAASRGERGSAEARLEARQSDDVAAREAGARRARVGRPRGRPRRAAEAEREGGSRELTIVAGHRRARGRACGHVQREQETASGGLEATGVKETRSYGALNALAREGRGTPPRWQARPRRRKRRGSRPPRQGSRLRARRGADRLPPRSTSPATS